MYGSDNRGGGARCIELKGQGGDRVLGGVMVVVVVEKWLQRAWVMESRSRDDGARRMQMVQRQVDVSRRCQAEGPEC